MDARLIGLRGMAILGLLAMVVGAIDPLEGSFVILPGAGLVALSAWLGKTNHRWRTFQAFVLVAIGVGVMILFSALGGIGVPGRPMWLAVFILPYPIGWLIGLYAAIRTLMELFRQPPSAKGESIEKAA